MNETSRNKLATCHPDLIRLAIAVSREYRIQCICGHRSDDEQRKAYSAGMSKLPPGKSKHNLKPSLAADFIPDPDGDAGTVDWKDIEEFEKMCAVFEKKAKELGIKIRLGRDFSFKDFPHIELVT